MSASAPAPKVPAAVKPVFDDIVSITDQFCHEHLDAEYAELCVKLAAKLARKRPSPLVRGDRRIWASGIVYTIGRVNFLADPSQQPHLRIDELAGLLGVKPTTMTNKGRLITDALRIGVMDPEYSRQDMIAKNPMAWLLKVNGLTVDARWLPYELQVEAWRRGLIPYVTAQAPDDQAGEPTAGPS